MPTKTPFTMTCGGEIKRARTAQHLTKGELAYLAGTSVTVITRVESGHNTTIVTFCKLCHALDLHPGAILQKAMQ